MKLTEALFQTTIDNIAGYISVKIKEAANISLAQAILFTRKTNTFKLLKDQRTGFYWDSISELREMIENEFYNDQYFKSARFSNSDFVSKVESGS